MCEMLIEKAMIIDDVECVKNELEVLSGKKIKDMEIVRKFICTEKNTKFFVDKKLKSSVNQDSENTYVWLDTGFQDLRNNALFISLLNTGYEYVGHHVGTARTLSDNVKTYFKTNKKEIEKNYPRFVSKYNQKCSERDNQHITDINQYLLCKVNEGDAGSNEIEMKIRQLNVTWIQEPEKLEDVVIEEPKVVETLSKQEEKVTIGYLLDIIEEREQYIQMLLEKIDDSDSENQVLVETIQSMSSVIQEQAMAIKDQNEAFTRIRTFNEKESIFQLHRDMKKEEKQRDMLGHNLLETHKKIAIVGDAKLATEVIKAILTKEYGFKETDFVYEIDYAKVVHASGRIIDSSRYQAIIFGCCPHSGCGKGKWSSIIESCKKNKESTLVVDARSQAGGLKVTKTSFRQALSEICMKLNKVA